MSFFTRIPLIGSLVESIAKRVATNKDQIIEGQNRINEAEVSGAPLSRLRLWRSFLGWVLALVFAWEAVMRPVILTYWPGAKLPQSMLGDVVHLLVGMLGLGI